MTAPAIIICIVVGLLFLYAIKRIFKKGTCGGKCGGCSGSCHSEYNCKDENNKNGKCK